MPRLMLSAGMLTALASSIALRSRGLPPGSPPPSRAAIVISLMSLVKRRPRLASAAPFLCLIVAHLLWPDIVFPRDRSRRGLYVPDEVRLDVLRYHGLSFPTTNGPGCRRRSC